MKRKKGWQLDFTYYLFGDMVSLLISMEETTNLKGDTVII